MTLGLFFRITFNWGWLEVFSQVPQCLILAFQTCPGWHQVSWARLEKRTNPSLRSQQSGWASFRPSFWHQPNIHGPSSCSKAEWTVVMSINSKPSTSNSCSYLAVGVKEIEEVIPEQLMENSLGKKRSRKVRTNTPVVDSIVRHSNRVRVSCNVFKMNICKAKNCLGCSSDPPTLSPTSLKKIGSSLCQLQPSQLDDQILLKKKKMDPIGKRQKKGKDSKDDKEKKAEDEEDFKKH